LPKDEKEASKKLFGRLPAILKELDDAWHFKKSGFSALMRLDTESAPAHAIDKIYVDITA
jgi:hypothetical protein